MTPLQQLTAKIYASNPELMTLGVGCEVKFKESDIVTITCFGVKNEYYRFINQNGTTYAWCENNIKESFEIIGKPPTLVDVRNYYKKVTKVETKAKFKNDVYDIFMDWNNSIYLRDQSPELINFLINLNK